MTGIIDSNEKYPNKKANECVLINGTDDIKSDLFFFVPPEEIAKTAKKCDLKVIKNAGVHFVFDTNLINSMDKEQFKNFIELHDYMTNHGSCTGMSIHCLLVCETP